MVFTSTVFFYAFLPLALLTYFLVPARHRAIPLLGVSLFFYAWGEPRLVVLIMASAAINYGTGRLLVKAKSHRSLLLTIGIIVNLAPLFILKYTDFILMNTGHPDLAERINLPLPIGVSFYTFMAIGYLVDIYRRRDEGSDTFVRFAAYLTMFPHLVAGPIVRWEHIGEQLRNPRFDARLFSYGAIRISTGVAKKSLIADQIANSADQLIALPHSPSTAAAWLAMLLYSLQIYLDFSAYSDIAIGLAAMLGVRFHENFDYPYSAKSAADFWRRWHISLGSWFRDYIYIPMGGSRVGRVKLWRNLMVVWALTGLWHGAAWTFIVWGLYFGVLIGLERTVYGKRLEQRSAVIQHSYGLLIAGIGWVIFRSTSLEQASDILSALWPFGSRPLTDVWSTHAINQNFVLLIIAIAISAGVGRPLMTKMHSLLFDHEGTISPLMTIMWSIVVIVLFVLATAFMVAVAYKPFIYFRF